MNMTQEDKELALRIAQEVFAPIEIEMEADSILDFAHRYHTAKLEQAASEVKPVAWVYGHEMVAVVQGQRPDERASWKPLCLADDANTAIAALTEEVEQLKAEIKETDERNIAYSNYERQQTLAAQLDNKRLLGDIDGVKRHARKHDLFAIESLCEISISTPLDTSAADKLMARVKELEVKLRMEEELHHAAEAGLNQTSDQLTAARSAMEKAISFCEDGLHRDQWWYVQEATAVLKQYLSP